GDRSFPNWGSLTPGSLIGASRSKAGSIKCRTAGSCGLRWSSEDNAWNNNMQLSGPGRLHPSASNASLNLVLSTAVTASRPALSGRVSGKNAPSGMQRRNPSQPYSLRHCHAAELRTAQTMGSSGADHTVRGKHAKIVDMAMAAGDHVGSGR